MFLFHESSPLDGSSGLAGEKRVKLKARIGWGTGRVARLSRKFRENVEKVSKKFQESFQKKPLPVTILQSARLS